MNNKNNDWYDFLRSLKEETQIFKYMKIQLEAEVNEVNEEIN